MITDKLLEAKFREMEIKNPKKTIKLKVRNVNFKDCLGIEEAFECKRRYSTVQCISPSAEVNKIKMIDLIDFFRRKDISFKEIEMIIKERKEMLINLLKNNLNVENDIARLEQPSMSFFVLSGFCPTWNVGNTFYKEKSDSKIKNFKVSV